VPRKGFKTITIREEVHKLLEEYAERNYTSVPKAVEKLIKKANEKEVSQ